jgi:hypothetical protein
MNAPVLIDTRKRRLHRLTRIRHDVSDATATETLICRIFGGSLST